MLENEKQEGVREKVKKQLPGWAALCIIGMVAGLLLGLTNGLTAPAIQQQSELAADAARQAVLPLAQTFEQQQMEEGAGVDYCYQGLSQAGDLVGYTAQVTVKGYGGEIEVVVGMDYTGTITGVQVGGSNFAETPGLGARTKEPAFTEQFRGVVPPAVLKENVDAVTSATISSGAVVSGVNKAAKHIAALLSGGTAEAKEENPLPGATDLVEQPGAEGIDAWWKAAQGIVVQVTEQGFGGPVQVKVGIDATGAITGVVIGGDGFAETPSLGERVLEAEFRAQFVGAKGAVEYGQGIDAVSGATISSQAVRTAINRALDFGETVMETR